MRKVFFVILLSFSLPGCVWFAALPAASQITLVTGSLTGIAALTNADVSLITAYCKLRNCGSATVSPLTPATP